MPVRRSGADSSFIRTNAPRTLNDPVIWSDSSFSQTGTPAISESLREGSIGVRMTRSLRSSEAARIRPTVSKTGPVGGAASQRTRTIRIPRSMSRHIPSHGARRENQTRRTSKGGYA